VVASPIAASESASASGVGSGSSIAVIQLQAHVGVLVLLHHSDGSLLRTLRIPLVVPVQLQYQCPAASMMPNAVLASGIGVDTAAAAHVEIGVTVCVFLELLPWGGVAVYTDADVQQLADTTNDGKSVGAPLRVQAGDGSVPTIRMYSLSANGDSAVEGEGRSSPGIMATVETYGRQQLSAIRAGSCVISCYLHLLNHNCTLHDI
jgi:hypothetical protein